VSFLPRHGHQDSLHLVECVLAGPPTLHQPATNDASGTPDTAPAVHIDRATVSEVLIDCGKDASHFVLAAHVHVADVVVPFVNDLHPAFASERREQPRIR